MLASIGTSKAVSSRGKSRVRTIKAKPRPRFPVQNRGIKPKTEKRDWVAEIV